MLSHSILAAALLLASDVLATPETVVWFAQAGTAFTDSLMIGNGRLGASVWGGTSSDNIALNEDTLWSGGPYNPIHPGAHATLLTARAQINAQNWTNAEATINANVLGNPSSKHYSYVHIAVSLLFMPTEIHIYFTQRLWAQMHCLS
ncbi:glycosyl hydrolase family 65, N-terminal domain-containing protein [Mycena albidolilacea]|uniref:Glycosyl hydrolase family 65, N-terminal domain-containing protein n=1 Tax=Mycena albidolilacea TaxID=1033008 RepID=A0AAD7EN81_9AGAR|nr:glycosyl hydrolase family 65, N-terminal domain-containing protein [Mycena albidolilacea]